MAVGDVKSNERGSGARFNDGKVNLTLLPPWCWEELRDRVDEHKLLNVFYGRELRLLIEFWEGKDEALEDVIDCLDEDDFIEAARVFAYGAMKYAEWNWAKGMAWSVPMACYLRHMLLARPDEADEESGISHRGHAVCNLLMLAHFLQLCPDMDDRPKEIRPEWHAGKDEAPELDGDEVSIPGIRWEMGQKLMRKVDALFAESKEKFENALPDLDDEEPYFILVNHEPDEPLDEDEVNEMVERLKDAATPELNYAVEELVAEQEFRERVLRSTGQLV